MIRPTHFAGLNSTSWKRLLMVPHALLWTMELYHTNLNWKSAVGTGTFVMAPFLKFFLSSLSTSAVVLFLYCPRPDDGGHYTSSISKRPRASSNSHCAHAAHWKSKEELDNLYWIFHLFLVFNFCTLLTHQNWDVNFTERTSSVKSFRYSRLVLIAIAVSKY